jgi:hypothetical protein
VQRKIEGLRKKRNGQRSEKNGVQINKIKQKNRVLSKIFLFFFSKNFDE